LPSSPGSNPSLPNPIQFTFPPASSGAFFVLCRPRQIPCAVSENLLFAPESS
jgi:hypothetical protein